MTPIGISGVNGRMGRVLVQAAADRTDFKLVSATVRPDSSLLGSDCGGIAGARELGVPATDRHGDDARVVIDFTHPQATLAQIDWCRQRGSHLVIGTTGFEPAQRERIDEAARDIAVVMAPNMSVGVNLCFRLAELAARAAGADSDIEIIEAHHRHKADAPSGTALHLGEMVARALGRELDQAAVYERRGQTGPRRDGDIGFATIRAGDIVGEHTVLFASAGERIEITHKATSRLNFANGALRAARWVAEREPGLYDMQDVLGL